MTSHCCGLVAGMLRIVIAGILALSSAVSDGAGSATSNRAIGSPQPNSLESASSDSTGIPVGTEIVGTLSTKLDTKHAKVGDPVKIEVTQDVLKGNRLVLKKGSRVTGHVTDVSAYSRKVFNARLEIVLDRIVPTNSEQIPTYLAIYALAAKHDDASDNSLDSRPTTATAQAAGLTGGTGGPAGGVLKPDSKGVYNLYDLSLTPMARDHPPTSLVHSQSQDIHLDKGTGVVLIVEGNRLPPDRSSR